MDAGSIARQRRQALGLVTRDLPSVGAVVRHFSALQGQDFLPALWSLSQRTSGSTYDEACAAFDAGELLRTHVLRPTWHLVAPADLHWLLAATGPRVHRLNAPYYRALGVDDDARRVVRETLERVLPGKALTRTQIGAELAAAGLATPVGNRLASLVMYAELEGWVCSGPRAGNQHTYMLMAERAPASPPIDRREALERMARAYFGTRGPATVKDLAGWASLTVAEATEAASSLGDEFYELELEGRRFLAAGSPPPGAPAGTVDLIQGLDEWVMSYSESRGIGSDGPPAAEPPETYFHAILLDGRLVGRWRYDRDSRGRPHAIQVFTYRPLQRSELDALDAEVARFAGFVGRPVSWEMSDERRGMGDG
jgi:hypothetical protein